MHIHDSHFSAEEEERFQKRFEEGYDLHDPRYMSWLEINHPEAEHYACDINVDGPSLGDFFAQIMPCEPVCILSTTSSARNPPSACARDPPNSSAIDPSPHSLVIVLSPQVTPPLTCNLPQQVSRMFTPPLSHNLPLQVSPKVIPPPITCNLPHHVSQKPLLLPFIKPFLFG